MSQPCDVFRVLKGSTIAAMADLWTFKAARDKFLSINKVFSKTPYKGSCFRYIISVTPLRHWLPCIFIQNQLRRWKRILLLELPPLNHNVDPSALLSFLYMKKYTGRWANSHDAKRSTCVSCWPPDDSGTTPLTPNLWKERPHSDWLLPGDKWVSEKIPWSWQNIRMSNVSLFRGTDRVPPPCWGKTWLLRCPSIWLLSCSSEASWTAFGTANSSRWLMCS